MNRSAALTLLLLSLACVRPSSAADSGNSRIEADVRGLNTEEVAAFVQNDPAALARLWSEDFVVTNPLNKFVTKAQVLGMVRSGFLVITTLTREIEYVRVYGTTVVVAGRETVLWGGKMPNAGKSEQLRFTAIWMKQQGRWQEVARHANIVPAQSLSGPGA